MHHFQWSLAAENSGHTKTAGTYAYTSQWLGHHRGKIPLTKATRIAIFGRLEVNMVTVHTKQQEKCCAGLRD